MNCLGMGIVVGIHCWGLVMSAESEDLSLGFERGQSVSSAADCD